MCVHVHAHVHCIPLYQYSFSWLVLITWSCLAVIRCYVGQYFYTLRGSVLTSSHNVPLESCRDFNFPVTCLHFPGRSVKCAYRLALYMYTVHACNIKQIVDVHVHVHVPHLMRKDVTFGKFKWVALLCFASPNSAVEGANIRKFLKIQTSLFSSLLI